VHTFGTAYREKEVPSILKYSMSSFSTPSRTERYGNGGAETRRADSLRVNPGHAEVTTDMYNPCAPYSRLGVTYDRFKAQFPASGKMVDGLHFHPCASRTRIVTRKGPHRLRKALRAICEGAENG